MTLEEAIKRYTSNSFYEKSDGNLQGYLEFNQLAEWLKELKQLREQTQWIPVTEETELPEHDVICCNNEGDIALGYLYFDEEENQIACDHDPYVMFGVVAYMEFPEPYKAER